jgi:hypothetical protein
MEFQIWSSALRVLTYAVIFPGFLWFAFDYLAAGNRWLAALFGLLALERLYVLAAVSLEIALPGAKMATLDGLTPIVLVMALVMLRLMSGRVLARVWVWRLKGWRLKGWRWRGAALR